MIKTILLLDDDADEKSILDDAFKNIEVEVVIIQVTTVTQLLEFLNKSIVLPDLLLLDVNLPAQTGIEALRTLQTSESFSAMPIVMYTNTADQQTIDNCFEYGASAYVKKTTTLGRLEDHLRILMAWNLRNTFKLPLTERTFLN